MAEWGSSAALEGLAVDAIEWLPSGADAGLVRVRARWTDPARREAALPALGLRRGGEARRFESLPDARFGRDPAVFRGTYLVPAALMDPAPDELWLAWESGARAALSAAARGFEPPATEPMAPAPEPGGEVIDRAVLAERRARRAEAAERTQAQRAADALKAVEVLELRSAELERRLEALQAEPALPQLAEVAPEPDAAPPARLLRERAQEEGPRADALTAAVAAVKRLRTELGEQRQRLRRSELLRGADAVALASLREEEGKAQRLERQLAVAEARAAEALEARAQAAEQVALARRRAASDAADVRSRAAAELAAVSEAADRELAAERDRAAAAREATDLELAAERERAAAARAAAGEAQAERAIASRDLAAERTAHTGTRARLAQREEELAAIAAELAGVRAELARVSQDAAERGAELERRLAELDAALAAERRAHRGAATVLETARAGLAAAEAANRAESVARAALDEELDRERVARATLAGALDAARSELAHAHSLHADVVLTREQARAELTTLRGRAASADAAAQAELATLRERATSADAAAQAEVAAVRSRLAAAEAGLVDARAAAQAAQAQAADTDTAATELRAALETARAEAADADTAAAELRAALETARAEAADADTAAAELRAALETARAGAADASTAAERGELAAARARIAALERELEQGRGALTSAEHEAGGLLARIAELERPADDDLDRRAREQATAAAAAPRPAAEQRRELSASLDAAAAALRARIAEPAPEAAAVEPVVAEPALAEPAPAASDGGEVEPVVAEPVPAEAAPVPPDGGEVEPVVAVSAGGEVEPIVAVSAPAEVASVAPEGGEIEPDVAEPAPAEPPAAAAEPAAQAVPPPRPRIVTEAGHPPRGDLLRSSKREYPWLRGALVKLAHDDPRAATRMVLGLVPVQRALVTEPLEYDLTIRGSGTYAVSIGPDSASARTVGGPRPRGEAEFHVSADIVTLAELLAGVDKRMGRWLGAVKVHGRRRGAAALRDALAGADLDLAAAVRAGAELDPDLVFRAFAYAIRPAWTKGHTFTVAQEIVDPRPMRWHVAVRDGAPIAVERRAPSQAPDAVVVMTRAAFSHLLRGEPSPSGDRPAIRGDRAAVATLKAWTDRAQGRPA